MPQETDRTVRRVVAGVAALALLGGVGTLAALTGTAKQHDPTAGATRAAVAPPTLVFTDASDGWAFYPDCQRQLPTDGCTPELLATNDGGKNWKSVDLPIGAPTTTALWGRMQARGDSVVLPWAYGAYLSVDGGAHWTAPTPHGRTALLPKDSFVIRQGDQQLLASPAGNSVEALLPAIPLTAPWQLDMVGPDRAWVRDAHTFAVSADAGKSWHDTAASPGELELVVASPSATRLARLQIAVPRTTLGVAGDGGEYPVRGVLVTTDAGLTWQPRVVTGPPVNGACTVMMADGSLLGVGVDGKELLRLAPGGTAFAPLAGGPATVPACLSSVAGLVYGPTLDNRVAVSPDGTTWHLTKLPPRP